MRKAYILKGLKLPMSSYNRLEVLKVTIASLIGTAFDFYDFFVAGLASAVVWPTVFFPLSSPEAAVLYSITLYGIGYFTRPVGGLLFGHFGDRIGRRGTLVWTLITMGIGVGGIAFAPTYAQVGLLAPLLVAVFRLIQGLGAGGEFGGAASIVAEFAKDSKYRAFWVSWAQQGFSIGTIISSVVWFYVTSIYSRADLISYAWRIPFYIGIAVLIIGVIIRISISESPVFLKLLQTKAVLRYPSIEVIKKEWKKILISSLLPIPTVASGVFVSTFSAAYSVKLGISATFTSLTVVYGGIAGIFGIAAFALLADKIGRRRVLLMGGLLPTLYAFPYMLMLSTGSYSLTGLANILFVLIARFSSGVFPAVLTEIFPAKYRYSGAGTSYSIAAIWGGSILPLIASTIFSLIPNPIIVWPYIASVIFVAFLISIVPLLVIKETKEIDIST
jgi:MHS family shikimate/dehydroshikimate transporter-like MFS transporter